MNKCFVRSFETTIDTGYRVVVISPFYFSKGSTVEQILAELKKVRKIHAQSRLPICVSFSVSDRKLMKALKLARGWKFSFMKYSGRVETSIKRLEVSCEKNSEIQLRPAKLESDREEIHRMELKAFKMKRKACFFDLGYPIKKRGSGNMRRDRPHSWRSPGLRSLVTLDLKKSPGNQSRILYPASRFIRRTRVKESRRCCTRKDSQASLLKARGTTMVSHRPRKLSKWRSY